MTINELKRNAIKAIFVTPFCTPNAMLNTLFLIPGVSYETRVSSSFLFHAIAIMRGWPQKINKKLLKQKLLKIFIFINA
jgi:arginine exporter protein ArgO